MNKRGFLALLGVMALVMSACTFQFTTQINEDGSGAQIIEFGVTADEQEQIQALMAMSGDSTGASPDDFSMEQLCQDEDILSEVPVDATLELEQRDDGDWCVARREFSSLDGLRQILTEGEMGLNTLEMTEDTFLIDLDFDLSDMAGEDLSSLELLGFSFDFVFKLKAPGTPVNHNADEYDEASNTLIWHMEPGGINNIHAEMDLKTFPTTLVVGIVVGVVVLALVVVAIIFFSRRSKTPPSDMETLPPAQEM